MNNFAKSEERISHGGEEGRMRRGGRGGNPELKILTVYRYKFDKGEGGGHLESNPSNWNVTILVINYCDVSRESVLYLLTWGLYWNLR